MWSFGVVEYPPFLDDDLGFPQGEEDFPVQAFVPQLAVEALAGELINDVEHAEGLAVMGAVHDEVVRPDVVPVRRSQPDAGPVIEPEPSPLRLLLWYFEPFTSPDALYPLQADGPTILLKQPVDAPVSISAEPGSQADDRPCQDIFIGSAPWQLALCRAVLAEHHASTALGHLQLADNMIDTATAA